MGSGKGLRQWAAPEKRLAEAEMIFRARALHGAADLQGKEVAIVYLCPPGTHQP